MMSFPSSIFFSYTIDCIISLFSSFTTGFSSNTDFMRSLLTLFVEVGSIIELDSLRSEKEDSTKEFGSKITVLAL